MSDFDEDTRHDQSGEFIDSMERSSQGFLAEIFRFLKAERNWILIPIIIMLLLFGALVVLGGGAMAPFIYTLF